MKATTRISKDERRREIIEAATREFAVGGLHGTPVGRIAKSVGVSQPYLFQLFGTKKDLFIAAVRDCFDRTEQAFERSGKPSREAGLRPEQILEEMGHAYVRLLLADRGILRLQLQAYAACGDPDIQTVVRDNYGGLWQTVATLSGADPDEVHRWFAEGMLINVIASISNTSTMEGFFHSLMAGDFRRC